MSDGASLIRPTALEEGGIDVSGSYVWESDASCKLNGASGDLSIAGGDAVNDMPNNYSQFSATTTAAAPATCQ